MSAKKAATSKTAILKAATPVSAIDEIAARRQEQQWQARIDNVRHSDRAAVDIGINAVKTAILINAGALVALLTFVGQQWKIDSLITALVLKASSRFVWGLIIAVGGTAIAYIRQSLITKTYQLELNAFSTGRASPSLKWVRATVIILALIMVGSFLASYIEFIIGAHRVASALRS